MLYEVKLHKIVLLLLLLQLLLLLLPSSYKL
jgi:hypothetical protein